jgi:hypothetical protein
MNGCFVVLDKSRQWEGLPLHMMVDVAQTVCWICRPLLLRIKTAYDEALKDAAEAACDNDYLQSKMAMVPHRHVSELKLLQAWHVMIMQFFTASKLPCPVVCSSLLVAYAHALLDVCWHIWISHTHASTPAP